MSVVRDGDDESLGGAQPRQVASVQATTVQADAYRRIGRINWNTTCILNDRLGSRTRAASTRAESTQGGCVAAVVATTLARERIDRRALVRVIGSEFLVRGHEGCYVSFPHVAVRVKDGRRYSVSGLALLENALRKKGVRHPDSIGAVKGCRSEWKTVISTVSKTVSKSFSHRPRQWRRLLNYTASRAGVYLQTLRIHNLYIVFFG